MNDPYQHQGCGDENKGGICPINMIHWYGLLADVLSHGVEQSRCQVPGLFFVPTHAAESFRQSSFPYYARDSPEATG